MGRVALAATGVTGAACAYYTWRVEEKRKDQREATANRARFASVGSVDDLASDHLRPGDVVVFERDCSCLHLPLAVHCAMTKLLLKSACDHVGVVFTDRKTLLPHVLEAVPWQGVVASSFTDRVASGTDTRITVRALKLPKSSRDSAAAATAETSGGAAGGGAGTELGLGMRERRVADRVNAFAHGALGSTKVPTQAQVRRLCVDLAFFPSIYL